MPHEQTQTKPFCFDRAGLEKLLARADGGDESAAPEIRDLLDKAPELVQPLGGDLARTAERALVRAIVGTNIGLREALYRKMELMRRELAGPSPQPLERLLVERVVLCWLHAYHADCQYGQAGGVTLDYGQYLQRQQDRAQRRYLAAIKCLATVRGLALPIKLDVTVGGTVETTSSRATCRRPAGPVRAAQPRATLRSATVVSSRVAQDIGMDATNLHRTPATARRAAQ